MKQLLILAALLVLATFQSCRSTGNHRHTPTYYYDMRNVLSKRLADLGASKRADSLKPVGTYYNYGNYYFRNPLDLPRSEVTIYSGNGYSVISYNLNVETKLADSDLAKALPDDSLRWFTDMIEQREDAKRMYRLKSYNSDWHRPTKLPTFNFIDKKGHQINNSTVKGAPLVINFWSSYCPPCIREIPELNRWLDSIDGVNFVAVTYQNAPVAKRAVDKYGFKWNQVVEDSTLTTWLPSESHYPVHVVVDHNGYVRCMEYGGSDKIHSRVLDTLRSVMENGPLTRPRHYKDLHHEEEYSSF